MLEGSGGRFFRCDKIDEGSRGCPRCRYGRRVCLLSSLERSRLFDIVDLGTIWRQLAVGTGRTFDK
jgi:hypothetical protein